MDYHHYYFLIGMMPLNNVLKKCKAGEKLSKLQEKINHLICLIAIKLFAKSEKHIGMEFDVENGVMLIMKNRKRNMIEGMKLTNQEKNRTLGEKETKNYLGILK